METKSEQENKVTLVVSDSYSIGDRIDLYLTRQLPKISRSKIQKLIRDGKVLVNGAACKSSLIVQGGEELEITFPSPPRSPATAEDIPIDLLYEDEHLLIVNKPAGMVVHPAAGHREGTLVNALLWHYTNLPERDGEFPRPGIVHRLDKDTSGILVVAKSEYVLMKLSALFHEHQVVREYQAIVWGAPPGKGTIDASIARHPSDRKKFAVRPEGKRAVTHWQVLEDFGFLSYLKVTLETGRTHQIRVHLSNEGWPVFADPVYGGMLHSLDKLTASQRNLVRDLLKTMPRQALHAGVLGFIHPVTNEEMLFKAPLPDDFQLLLDRVRAVMNDLI